MNVLFIWLYQGGEPSNTDNYQTTDASALQVFTILNISNSKVKVVGVFF